MSPSARALAIRASFSSEREILPASSPDLAVDVENLRLQFLDTRMAIEQRGRLFGKLGAQRNALFGQAADQLRIQNF